MSLRDIVTCPDCGKSLQRRGLAGHRFFIHGAKTGVARYAAGIVDAPPDNSNRRMTMHYCPDCGTQVQEEARLCPTCGTNLMAYTQLSQTPSETILDFLTIKRMYTPLLIRLLFWLGTVAVAGFGITLFITGNAVNVRLLGLIYLIMGPVVVRISSEMLMLVVRMDESLTQIKNNRHGKE